jgi:WW domain-containing oxidoreductase
MSKSVVFGSRSTADQVIAGIDLNGKHMIVTGCSSGIGFETMNSLAANGAHVIGLASTLQGASRACEQVAYHTTPLACDLGSFDSVNAAVDSIRDLREPLDAIILNAAIARPLRLATRYGVEQQFLVNHLGHFALVQGLLDRLRDSSGRVVIVGDAGAVSQAPDAGILFDNLSGRRSYDPESFYVQSKLAIALFSKELARRLAPRGIAVNTANPGRVRGTRLHRAATGVNKIWRSLTAPFAKTRAQGAATSVLLAASPTVVGITGENWSDCQITETPAMERDTALGQRLWHLSEQIICAKPEAAAALQAAA